MRTLLLFTLALALVACRPSTAPTTAPPAPAYTPTRQCDGPWLRVRAPDGALSELREGLDCAALTPGAWACCDGADGLACRPVAECRGEPASATTWTQPGTRPTAAEVEAFTAFMAAQSHARVFDKTAAAEMQLVGDFLAAVHIQSSVEHFLEDSATTIPLPGPDGQVAAIYYPYRPGIARGPWDLDVQMGAAVHEPEHALEYTRDGPGLMTWRYLVSPRWRVEYECEAYQGQRAYLVWRGALGYPPDMFGELLSEYGLGPPWVAYARALMSAAAVAIDRGAQAPMAWRLARPWLERAAPELRGVQVPR